MSRIAQSFVVKELLHYYKQYIGNPVYQARTLECWRMNSAEGPYCGAYAETVRQIERGEKE